MPGPVLNLINGPIVADAIKDPQNNISKIVATEKDDARIVEELFLSILCRPASKQELAAGIQALRGSNDEYARQMAEHARLQAAVAEHEKSLPARQATWEKTVKNSIWTVLEPGSFKSAGGAVLTKEADNSLLASGKNPSPESYTVTAITRETAITALRLEVLSDRRLPAGGPGRAPNGNFVLNEFKVTAAPQADPGKGKPVALHKAVAHFSQAGSAVAGAIDGNPGTGWAVAPAFGATHRAVFEAREPVGFPAGTMLTFTLDQRFAGKDHNIGKFRISVSTAKGAIPLEGLPDA